MALCSSLPPLPPIFSLDNIMNIEKNKFVTESQSAFLFLCMGCLSNQFSILTEEQGLPKV